MRAVITHGDVGANLVFAPIRPDVGGHRAGDRKVGNHKDRPYSASRAQTGSVIRCPHQGHVPAVSER